MRSRLQSLLSQFARIGVPASVLLPIVTLAAPGDTLFSENFNGNLNSWTVTSSGGDANIDNNTAASGRSLELRWGTVAVESDPIDASAAAGVQLSVWIRRGSDSFSEDPDTDEDFFVDFRDSGGTWNLLINYPGDGTPGETFMPALQLPPAALHANLSIRFRTTGNDGSDWDYWHVDDLVVTETAAAVSGFGLDSCEDFESGLGTWTITSSGGSAGVSTQTAQSPSASLFTQGGAVSVTSPAEDLSLAISVDISAWVRRGSDSFSEDPDTGEDFAIEFLDDGGSWVQLGSFAGNGSPGETFLLNYNLPASALHAGFQVRFRQVNGDAGNWDYWHTDDVCLTGIQPILYSFEETVWTGAAGEVEEAYGSGLDGVATGGANIATSSPALTGNPGTCNYGDFDGTNDYIEFPDDPAFDITSELTVAAWINMRTLPSGGLHTIVSKDTNYEYHINSSGQVFWWWNDSGGTTRSFATSSSINLNQWHHVAITYESGSQVIYIDGVSAATQSFTGDLITNNLPLFIGTDYNFISRAFDGLIDEVYLAPSALSQADIVTLRDATHPCASANAQFSINHDNFGIHCAPETIVVDVIDSVAGTPRLDYNGQVQLATQTGNGTWQLVAGSGGFADVVSDDGLATYSWPLGESQATFALSYTQGTPTMDIDVVQISDPGIRDTDAEGALVFSASGFTVTAAALSNPPPGVILLFDATQTAAVPFTVHIAAYGQTATDPTCGIIESYTGDMPIAFWSAYNNPSSGTLAVAIDGNTIATNEAGASTQTVAFTNGQAVVTGRYDDVGALAIALKDESTTDPTQLPVGIRGATASFVSRPANFAISDVRDASGTIINPQAVVATDDAFIAAGVPFRATVTALDADGDPTPNYGQESTAENVRLDVELLAPSGGAAPAVSAATGFASFAGGVATATDLIWNEVGIMRVRAGIGDADYLGAGDVLGSVSENIGRFIPDHFTTVLNTPSFDTVCTAGGFSYVGEQFGYLTQPEIRATARAAGGTATLNYTGDFFKMTTGTLGARNYSATTGTLDLTGLPGGGDPAVSEDGPGVALIVFDSGSGLAFTRATPVDLFDAEIELGIDVIDGDTVAAASNPVTFGAGSGIVFSNGAEFRYGRVRFVNAAGSELVNLPVQLFAEHYIDAATGFVRNTDDSCTTGVSISFTGFTEDLSAGETCVLDTGLPGQSGVGCVAPAAPADQFAEPPVAGSFNLILAAPGAGDSGSATLEADVPTWLEFDWDAATLGDEDPSAQATFGIFGGPRQQIYTREVFN